MRLLRLPANIWRWFWHEQPWKWRPFWEASYNGNTCWTLIPFPLPYINWSDDGLLDFDSLGIEITFGPWQVGIGLNDND